MNLEPTLLTDTNRLQEIYDLRVDVWESSEKNDFVNRRLFPNGWFDELDETGYNFIIEDNGKIIASARLNYFARIDEFPFYTDIQNIKLPTEIPFGYYSRLVVANQFQGNGISRKLDDAIINLATQLNLKWIIGLASERTDLMVKKLGFANYGSANVKYHDNSDAHLINVIIKHI